MVRLVDHSSSFSLTNSHPTDPLAIPGLTGRQTATGGCGSPSLLQVKNEAAFEERPQPTISHIHCVTLPLLNLVICKGIGILWLYQSNPPVERGWVSLLRNPERTSVRRYMRTREECVGGNGVGIGLAATASAVGTGFSVSANSGRSYPDCWKRHAVLFGPAWPQNMSPSQRAITMPSKHA